MNTRQICFTLSLLISILNASLGAEGNGTGSDKPGAAGKTSSKPKPWFQYKSEGIEVPAATADEPKVKTFGPDTVRAARKYLDDGAHHWVREKSCIACHSTGTYMVDRPVLTSLLGKPSEEVLADFIDNIPKPEAKSDINAFTSVWRSSGLASWDKYVIGKLSEHTALSLQRTMTRLEPGGFFKTYTEVEIPYITTHFQLTVQAARAVVSAPGWLANLQDADTLERVGRMKKFLREHEPVNDYELALKLQLATLLPELVPASQRDDATAMLWRLQQSDGGWSTRRMSPVMKWHETVDAETVAMLAAEPDAASPASDPYMTAFAIVLLRESGVPTSDSRIQKGVVWLKRNQRVSGRWWMKSLYKDTYHYITYISTVQALRALALCGEVPKLSGMEL
jgi:squalene-hopene/tetraprenyl-beta-curcumene cyclase